MKSNSEYKSIAADALSGNWLKGAAATFIYFFVLGVIPSVCSFSLTGSDDEVGSGDILGNIVQLLLIPLTYGFYTLFLSIFRRENPRLEQIFEGFKQYSRTLGTFLLMGIYEFLWALLFIIPGIVKGYSYAMTPFIMKDNPSLQNNAAIEESMRLMQGHKMQLFLLDLSMIGWVILSFLTLGIGFLFLVPYNQTAHAAFYQDLIAEDEQNNFEDEADSLTAPAGEPDFEEVR